MSPSPVGQFRTCLRTTGISSCARSASSYPSCERGPSAQSCTHLRHALISLNFCSQLPTALSAAVMTMRAISGVRSDEAASFRDLCRYIRTRRANSTGTEQIQADTSHCRKMSNPLGACCGLKPRASPPVLGGTGLDWQVTAESVTADRYAACGPRGGIWLRLREVGRGRS